MLTKANCSPEFMMKSQRLGHLLCLSPPGVSDGVWRTFHATQRAPRTTIGTCHATSISPLTVALEPSRQGDVRYCRAMRLRFEALFFSSPHSGGINK